MKTMVPQMTEVLRVTKETPDVRTLVLDARRLDRPFHSRPGQFNLLYAFGEGEAAISLSGDSRESGELVHTIRAVGGVTRHLCELTRGEMVGVRGPFGQAWPVDRAVGSDLLLVAGGLGLAPLRPVIYEVLHRRDEFDRVALVYGARTPEDLLFKPELDRWSQAFDVLTTVDVADTGWRGPVGVVTPLVDRIELSPEGCVVMMCGPEIMMRFVQRALEGHGVASDRIFVSMERQMKCGYGRCGRCQFGADFVCTDGPVFSVDAIASRWTVAEV
jgi:NAD(P)H-flavin reductase